MFWHSEWFETTTALSHSGAQLTAHLYSPWSSTASELKPSSCNDATWWSWLWCYYALPCFTSLPRLAWDFALKLPLPPLPCSGRLQHVGCCCRDCSVLLWFLSNFGCCFLLCCCYCGFVLAVGPVMRFHERLKHRIHGWALWASPLELASRAFFEFNDSYVAISMLRRADFSLATLTAGFLVASGSQFVHNQLSNSGNCGHRTLKCVSGSEISKSWPPMATH